MEEKAGLTSVYRTELFLRPMALLCAAEDGNNRFNYTQSVRCTDDRHLLGQNDVLAKSVIDSIEKVRNDPSLRYQVEPDIEFLHTPGRNDFEIRFDGSAVNNWLQKNGVSKCGSGISNNYVGPLLEMHKLIKSEPQNTSDGRSRGNIEEIVTRINFKRKL